MMCLPHYCYALFPNPPSSVYIEINIYDDIMNNTCIGTANVTLLGSEKQNLGKLDSFGHFLWQANVCVEYGAINR